MFRLIWWDRSGMTLEGYSDSVGYSNAYLGGEMFIGNGWWLHGCGRYAAIHIQGVLNTLKLKRNGWHLKTTSLDVFVWQHWFFLTPLLQQSWRRGILVSLCPSVCLSICGHSHVCSVSSTLLAQSISYLHMLSTKFRMTQLTDAYMHHEATKC